jgi:hypothetical protein
MAHFQLTDDEILGITTHSGDPRTIFDLLPMKVVPANPKWIRLVAKYQCKDPIKCMRPGCGQPHNEGAIVEIKTNDRDGLINIGHDCGEQLFPDDYRAGKTRFEADLERKHLIIRKREILSMEPRIIGWFLTTQKPFQDYDKKRTEFEAFMPDLLDELKDAIRYQNNELRSFNVASSVFRSALAADGFKSGDYGSWSTVYKLKGEQFFSQGRLIVRSDTKRQESQHFLERLRPDNLSVNEMRECINGLKNIGDAMASMIAQYQDMFIALSPENLHGIAKWLKHEHPDWPYKYEHNALVRSPDGNLPGHHLTMETDIQQIPICSFPLSVAA